MALAHVERNVPETNDHLAVYPEEFTLLDEVNAQHPLSPEDVERYGEYELIETYLLETPIEVLEADPPRVLTNPSQILHVPGGKDDEIFAYFRDEPTRQHLGKTRSTPYRILFDLTGQPFLKPFPEIMSVPGEDPRVTENVPYLDENGDLQVGWCVSTVVATPRSDTYDPQDLLDPTWVYDIEKETVDHIEQVFYCGPTLADLKPVVRIRGLKNTTISPVEDPDNPGTMLLDVFGRPKPHITYCGRIKHIGELTADMVEKGIKITERFLPEGIHAGVNTPRRVPGDPNSIELDIHTACAPKDEDGKRVLAYRLERSVFEIPSAEHPKGVYKPLGIIACRGNFAEDDPKPGEGDVSNFYNVLYGSKGLMFIVHPVHGLVEVMVTGMSDRHVGVALLRRKDTTRAA